MDSYNSFYLLVNTALDGCMRATLEAQFRALRNAYWKPFMNRMEVYRPAGSRVIHASLEITSECWHMPGENPLHMIASWVFNKDDFSLHCECKIFAYEMLIHASTDEIRELQTEPEARRVAIKKLATDLKAIMRRAREPGHVLHLIPTLGMLVKSDIRPVRPREPYLPALSEESLTTLTTLVLSK